MKLAKVSETLTVTDLLAVIYNKLDAKGNEETSQQESTWIDTGDSCIRRWKAAVLDSNEDVCPIILSQKLGFMALGIILIKHWGETSIIFTSKWNR